MTREQAEQIVKEAVVQGWAEEANAPYESHAGRIDVHHFEGDISAVELKIAGGWTEDQYWIRDTEEWRKLKAKTDEIKQILQEVAERGWDAETQVHRAGKLGMKIEVYPPGYRRPYGVRVGGMRTWRKVCREADDIITDPSTLLTLEEG